MTTPTRNTTRHCRRCGDLFTVPKRLAPKHSRCPRCVKQMRGVLTNDNAR